jgi:hypothetical protein
MAIPRYLASKPQGRREFAGLPFAFEFDLGDDETAETPLINIHLDREVAEHDGTAPLRETSPLRAGPQRCELAR